MIYFPFRETLYKQGLLQLKTIILILFYMYLVSYPKERT
jgi:hypothetical protein